MTTPHLSQTWDALTIDELRARGSIKWTLFPDTIGAWVAEMDFGIAPPVAEAIRRVADTNETGYMPLGLAGDLAEATSGFLARRFGWEVPAAQIGVVGDVLRAYELAFGNWLAPGLPVIVPTPSYPPFLALPKLFGREVIEVPCLRDPEGIWRLDEAGIEAALAQGGLLVLCSPHNPLGRLYAREELERIAAIASRTGARVFADEIHAPLLYPGTRHIPYATLNAETAKHTISAVSASKTWNIPGLTCAQMVFSNAEDAEAFHALGHLVTRGASNVGARASIAAYTLGEPWLEEVMGYLDSNRRHLAARLAAELPGALHRMPEATYLAWIDVSALTNRRDLAKLLREEAGVAVTGGEDCGTGGAGAFRLNFATPRPILDAAIDRIVAQFGRT